MQYKRIKTKIFKSLDKAQEYMYSLMDIFPYHTVIIEAIIDFTENVAIVWAEDRLLEDTVEAILMYQRSGDITKINFIREHVENLMRIDAVDSKTYQSILDRIDTILKFTREGSEDSQNEGKDHNN